VRLAVEEGEKFLDDPGGKIVEWAGDRGPSKFSLEGRREEGEPVREGSCRARNRKGPQQQMRISGRMLTLTRKE